MVQASQDVAVMNLDCQEGYAGGTNTQQVARGHAADIGKVRKTRDTTSRIVKGIRLRVAETIPRKSDLGRLEAEGVCGGFLGA